MESLEEKIALAKDHVESGRRIVTEQRREIAGGRGGADAIGLLNTFERSLEIFEADLDNLLRQRGQP